MSHDLLEVLYELGIAVKIWCYMWGDDKFGHMLKTVRNRLFVLTDVYFNVTCVTCYVCNMKTFGEIMVSFCFVTLRMLFVTYVTLLYTKK